VAGRSTTAIIDPIRIVWRKGLTVRRWHRILRDFWLRCRRWWLLFDGRIRRWWYVGAFCKRIVYRSKLGKLESPIGFAVGRHCLCSGYPRSELPCTAIQNGQWQRSKYNPQQSCLDFGIGSAWLVLRCDCLFGRVS
jgi:hypothetical protein